MKERFGAPLSSDITPVLREFVNALAKSSMYPAGHKFAIQTAEHFTEHLAVALEARGTITLGFTPRAVLLDGTAIDPLPLPFRQFGQRLHRRNRREV